MKKRTKLDKVIMGSIEVYFRLCALALGVLLIVSILGLGFIYYADILLKTDILIIQYQGQIVSHLFAIMPVGFLLLGITTCTVIGFKVLEITSRKCSILFPGEFVAESEE
jgi:hypothetical protein